MTKRIMTMAAAGMAMATAFVAMPAQARPHRGMVCHMEHHHGHRVRVCHHR